MINGDVNVILMREVPTHVLQEVQGFENYKPVDTEESDKRQARMLYNQFKRGTTLNSIQRRQTLRKSLHTHKPTPSIANFIGSAAGSQDQDSCNSPRSRTPAKQSNGRISPGVFSNGSNDSENMQKESVETQPQEGIIQTLSKGSYFGEIALLTNMKRTATVRAVEYVTLAQITREDFSTCQ